MGQILVRNMDEAVIKRLKARAREKGHSLQAEVKSILEETSRMDKLDKEAAFRLADSIRLSLGRTFGDSAEMIRNDRDWLSTRRDRGAR